MSKQRQKGSTWETELLPQLRAVFGPQVERAPLKGVNDMGDFTGTPVLIEAKKTDVPHFLQWAKTCAKKAGVRWAVIWSGDRRRGDGPFVLLHLDYFLRLAKNQQYVAGMLAATAEIEIPEVVGFGSPGKFTSDVDTISRGQMLVDLGRVDL